MNKKLIIPIMFALLLVIPLSVVASGSASPGSTNTVLGIPVLQTFTGLDASTAYKLVCTTYDNDTVLFTSDSSGEYSISIICPEYGANSYAVETVAQTKGMTFTIDNMDIMPYIVILITVSILFSVIGMFTKGKLF